MSDWKPLLLSSIAGASTCIGAAIVFCLPKKEGVRVVKPGMMAFSLSLAGSVMVTVSVISIIPECLMDTSIKEDEQYKMIPFFSFDMLCRIISFGLGSFLYFGLSRFFALPEPDEILSSNINDVLGRLEPSEKLLNPSKNVPLQAQKLKDLSCDDYQNGDIIQEVHVMEEQGVLRTRAKGLNKVGMESPLVDDTDNGKIKICRTRYSSYCNKFSLSVWTSGNDLETKSQKEAWRVAMLLFVSLLVHNFPEGLAVAASALESEKLGVTVTVGIMIHNIPEGIAIAIPCLAAKPDNPWLSFSLASISGLAEPFGAFVSLLFLRGLEISDDGKHVEPLVINLENVLAFVAGIMVMVAFWELFPEARRHVDNTWCYFWYGTMLGIIVMVVTEIYLP